MSAERQSSEDSASFVCFHGPPPERPAGHKWSDTPPPEPPRDEPLAEGSDVPADQALPLQSPADDRDVFSNKSTSDQHKQQLRQLFQQYQQPLNDLFQQYQGHQLQREQLYLHNQQQVNKRHQHQQHQHQQHQHQQQLQQLCQQYQHHQQQMQLFYQRLCQQYYNRHQKQLGQLYQHHCQLYPQQQLYHQHQCETLAEDTNVPRDSAIAKRDPFEDSFSTVVSAEEAQRLQHQREALAEGSNVPATQDLPQESPADQRGALNDDEQGALNNDEASSSALAGTQVAHKMPTEQQGFSLFCSKVHVDGLGRAEAVEPSLTNENKKNTDHVTLVGNIVQHVCMSCLVGPVTKTFARNFTLRRVNDRRKRPKDTCPVCGTLSVACNPMLASTQNSHKMPATQQEFSPVCSKVHVDALAQAAAVEATPYDHNTKHTDQMKLVDPIKKACSCLVVPVTKAFTRNFTLGLVQEGRQHLTDKCAVCNTQSVGCCWQRTAYVRFDEAAPSGGLPESLIIGDREVRVKVCHKRE